jgi:hypothetical protein
VINLPDWLKAAIGALGAAFIAAVTAAVKHLWTKQKQQAARQAAIEDGILALLHDRIYSEYAACKAKKFASVDDLRNLEYLYRPYHALGGNGTGTELFERVKRMPDKPAEQETENA